MEAPNPLHAPAGHHFGGRRKPIARMVRERLKSAPHNR